MNGRRAAAVALLAVLGALVAVPAASMGAASGAPAALAHQPGTLAGSPAAVGWEPASVSGSANASNASLGTHLAAFVTAGVETADGSVERRMWQAAYEGSDNRSARADLVTERTAALEARLAALEAEKRDLVDRRRSGDISPVVFRARMSALAARLSALRAAIDDTAPRAAAVGADAARVRSLRERARNASGPELRQARSLGGGPPDGTPPGLAGTPPGQGGPPGEGGGPPGQGDGRTDDATSTATDVPEDGDCPGEGGPPEDVPDEGQSDDVPGEGPPDC